MTIWILMAVLYVTSNLPAPTQLPKQDALTKLEQEMDQLDEPAPKCGCDPFFGCDELFDTPCRRAK